MNFREHQASVNRFTFELVSVMYIERLLVSGDSQEYPQFSVLLDILRSQEQPIVRCCTLIRA